jgi:glycolate oxidase
VTGEAPPSGERRDRMARSSLTTDTSVRAAFARDASGLEMLPDAVARPRSAGEVAELLREASATRTPVTPAGGQSSTTAASIADRGIVLSLKSLDRVLDIDPVARTARVEPGLSVAELKRAVAASGLLWAPDPTSEEEATVGGAIACNASGARSLRYGPTRAHVRRLRVVLADGRLIELERPRVEKNTAGYAFAHDSVDWFVGSEGTLGVIVEAELALVPLPERVLGLAFPFACEADALAFVAAARESVAVHPRCLELFDARALEIVRDAGGDWGDGGRGDSPGWEAFIYTEEAVGEGAEPALDAWLALAEEHHALVADTRVFDGEAALREARRLRHAVPAHMNELGSRYRRAGGRKVSTDWAVPYRHLAAAIAAARTAAHRAGIEPPVIYGHAGNGHPHENFIARDADELRRVEQAVEDTLRHVLRLGGTVAAEHGIGKLKPKWLALQASPLQMGAMRALKRELDPLGILAPGNIFS